MVVVVVVELLNTKPEAGLTRDDPECPGSRERRQMKRGGAGRRSEPPGCKAPLIDILDGPQERRPRVSKGGRPG